MDAAAVDSIDGTAVVQNESSDEAALNQTNDNHNVSPDSDYQSAKHEASLPEQSNQPEDGSLESSQVVEDALKQIDPALDTNPIVSFSEASAMPPSSELILKSGSPENRVVGEDDDEDEDLFGEGDNDEGNENVVSGVNSDGPALEPPTGTDLRHGISDSYIHAADLEPHEEATQSAEKQQLASLYSPGAAAIPRKSNGLGSPISKRKPITYTKAALAALGLPDGVNVPYSVDKEKLLNNNPNNRKMMDTLRGLPVKLVNDALTEYDDAVQVKGNTIRNHGAYLYGVVKRYVAVHERALAGDSSGVLPMGETLSPAVHTRLEQLVITGFCTREEMNDKVKSKIKMLPEKDALFALDELSSVSRSQIRNFGSYFMGILNRYMRGDENKNSGANHYHQPSPQSKGVTSHYQRGRDRTSTYRDSNAPAYSYNSERDRSRDRFKGSDPNDHRRAPSNPRDSSGMLTQNAYSTDGRPVYDTRQQQQQQQQPSWQQNPSHNSIQQTNMMSFQNATGSRLAIRPSGAMDQQQSLMPGMPSNNFPSLSQPQQNMTSYVYQQQSHQPTTTNQQQQSNSSNPFVVSQSYQAGQQSYQQQQSMVTTGQAFNSNVGSVPQQYMQQPQFQLNMTSQQQQNQIPGFGRGTTQQQGLGVPMQQPTRVGGWQTTSQYQPQQTMGQSSNLLPLDILGLADKAASAVQALSAQNRPANTAMLPQSSYGQQQPQQVYTGQYQQPMYGAVGGGAVVSTPYSMQASQSMPTQTHYPQAQSQPQSTAHSFVNRTSGNQGFTTQDQNRRRTTASLNELPHGVQYAIQGLMASHAIEGPLDDGILGMIHDLPEGLAIASLQKFATLDKSNMRNRTAYLAGVLRRELEKIQRR